MVDWAEGVDGFQELRRMVSSGVVRRDLLAASASAIRGR